MDKPDYRNLTWVHYLTRPKEFFLINTLAKDFKGTKLKEVLGFGHDYWLFTCAGGETMDLYRRAEELAAADKFVREFITNETKLKDVFVQAQNVVKNIERLISAYRQHPPHVANQADFANAYRTAISHIIDYFVYVVEIPYSIGTILETDHLTGHAQYQWLLKECARFRSLSHYPEFHEHVLAYLLRSLASITGIDYQNLTLITNDEINSFLEGILTQRELSNAGQQRKHGFVCYAAFGKEQFLQDKSFLQSLYPEINIHTNEIKGNAAYAGLATGKVTVVITANDFAKFNDGNILVTIQSNPSFMPLLTRCSAIVADEGGIMSHAAIIARELKKPCVIGTKIATRVLKDGDIVEVNAHTGTITITSQSH